MSEEYFRPQLSPEEIEERMEGYSSWIEVDLDLVGFNLEGIRRRVGVEIIPVVKANAYGHGLVPIVAYLMKRGVERVLVAKLGEALQLREAGLTCGIINMDPLYVISDYDTVIEMGIIQTVFSRTTAERLNESAQRLGKTTQVFVKVDTGLNRVGVRYDRAADLIEYVSKLPRVGIEGVFSTLREEGDYGQVQLERMLSLDAELRRRGIDARTRTIGSSNAILHFPEAYLDAVRPGLILYGIYRKEEDREVNLELRQALSFKGRLEHVKWIEAGDILTYGHSFVASRRMKVGTIHVGYSDGYPRGLTNKGQVLVANEVRTVLGSVSMNHHVIDVTDIDAKVGDVVELMGREGENTLNRLASLAGIVPYRLLAGLNPLIPRVYYEKDRPIAISELKHIER